MALKITKAITTTIPITQSTTITYDSGRITRLAIITPVDNTQKTHARVDWVLGKSNTDGTFDVVVNQVMQIGPQDLANAMAQLVITGEGVGVAVERVIWDHLIKIGKVPAGIQQA